MADKSWRDGDASLGVSPILYGGSGSIVAGGLVNVDRAGMSAGFIVLIIIYLFGMAALAVRGWFLKQKAKADGGVEGYMNFHFLAGSKFGAIVLFCNWAAQYVGGIVVIKTPNDSRYLGYFMLMWISGCSWCGATFNVIQCRTREIMKGRNYLSPNDYLTDRYKNNLITGFGIISSTFQMVMFIGLEVLALQNVVQGILGNDTIEAHKNDIGGLGGLDHLISWLLFGFIYCCELLGGMASVALTDAIQAGLLLFAFFFLPFLVLGEYGGFEGVGGPTCQNRHVADNFGNVRSVCTTGQTTEVECTAAEGTWVAIGSAFDAWGTDACYQNSHEKDTASGCTFDLENPETGEGAKTDFPLSFLKFIGQAPVPGWKNVNHTFGKRSTWGDKVSASKYAEVCNMPKTIAGSIKGASTQCPPAGWKYVDSHDLLSHFGVGWNNLTASHHTLELVCTGTGNDEQCNYGGKSMVATPSGSAYIAYLLTPAGDKYYTNERMSSTQIGCIAINTWSSWFYKYQPREIAAYMFSFGFMWIAFAMTPITLHRTMTAKSSDEVRKALAVLHLFPICFFLPVILLGITAGGLWQETTFAAGQGAGNDAFTGTISGFALICFKVAETSGFGAFISILAMVGCCASFMSTADSIVLCGSMLFTVDFYYHLVCKNNVSVGKLVIVSKVVSCAMVVVGVSVGLYSSIDFVEILNIGNGVAGALIPVYMGMFMHALQPAEVFVGQVVNLIFVLTFEAMRFYPVNSWGAAPATWNVTHDGPWHGCPTCEAHKVLREARGDEGYPYMGVSRVSPALIAPLGDGNPDEVYIWLLPPFWGVISTVTATLVCHFLFKHVLKGVNPWFDRVAGLPVDVVKNFGAQRLDLDREGKITAQLMEGVKEPVKTPMAWPFIMFPFVVPWLFLPYYNDPYTNCASVGGMPDWGFNFTIVNSLGTACLMIVCVFFWKGREGEGDDAGDDFAVFGGGKSNSVAPSSTKVQM